MRLAIALFLAASLPGCFSPDYVEGFPCGTPPDECPADLTCIGGVCRKGNGSPIDAPLAMNFDAPPPETGPLQVKVFRPDNSIGAGLTVVFHDPAGHVLAVKTTDANGETQNDITTGGAVTVAFFDAQGRPDRLRSAGGLAPNRTLTIGKGEVADPTVLTAMITPPVSPPTNTDELRYEAGNGCSTSSGTAPPGPVALTIRQRCVASGGTYSVIAYAVDATGKVLGYSTLPGIATSTTAVPLPPWQTTFSTFQLNLSNAPQATAAPCLTTDAGSQDQCAEGAIDAFAAGIGYRPESGKNFPLLPLGSTTLSFRLPTGFFDALRYQVALPYGPGPTDGIAIYLHQVAGVPTNDPVNLGAVLPPRVHNTRVQPGSMPFVVEFDTDATPTGMDAFTTGVQWEVATDGGTDFRQWLMILPPTTTSPVRFPELPAELAGFFEGGPLTVEGASGFFVDFDIYDSYVDNVSAIFTALFDDDGILPGPVTVRASGVLN